MFETAGRAMAVSDECGFWWSHSGSEVDGTKRRGEEKGERHAWSQMGGSGGRLGSSVGTSHSRSASRPPSGSAGCDLGKVGCKKVDCCPKLSSEDVLLFSRAVASGLTVRSFDVDSAAPRADWLPPCPFIALRHCLYSVIA